MRIWSLHPKYLDSKGLVALWRETLLAKNVLEGNTNGYKNHPQLNRFKQAQNPIDSINQYLFDVYQEASRRGYNFNEQKFDKGFKPDLLKVTRGQLKYESDHLIKKLKIRSNEKYHEFIKILNVEPHPLFSIVEGDIEDWEIVL